MRLLYFLAILVPCQAKVKLLLAVWRHGDRAPEQLPYPSDPYNETFWPRGWNQLTNLGIEQGFRLGTFLRRRYKDTVLPEFDRNKVFIRASDADRAIETAQIVATALFPPVGKQIWNQGKYRYWQPIPIRTNGGKPDPVLRPSQIPCPAYKKLVIDEQKGVEARINKEYEHVFKVLSNRIQHDIGYNNIKDVYNIILEHENGLPFPKWANETVDGRTLLEHISEIRRISRLQLFDSPGKAKFMAGYLINNWADYMVAASNGTSPRKAVLYSSHDGTLTALLYGLGVSNHQLIPYTACAMVELHEDNTVQIFYRNTTTENPADVYRLILPECSALCPLEKFLQIVEKIRVRSLDELTAQCALRGSSTSAPSISLFSGLITFCILKCFL